jgi:hypothetical protein
MQTWEHCKVVGNRLYYLGASILENRMDHKLSDRAAWDYIERERWELVTVVYDPEHNELVHYFKRPK